MRDSKNFKAHLKMCKNYMGSTIQYDLELQYSLQPVQNTDIHIYEKVDCEIRSGTPSTSSSQDNCYKKSKCQIL